MELVDGLFATDKTGITVSNLGIVNGNIKGNNNSAAAIIGYVYNNNAETKIINCYNIASAVEDSSMYIGGMIGWCVNSKITISNCYNSSSIQNATYSGAMIGSCQNSTCTVSNCYNDVELSGGTSGGIIGYSSNSECIIKDCYNSGKITATIYTAGIVALADSR